ncbi:MFS transporter [Micromonospora sp. CPCC 206060]|uniref:MFS transporter n=1 Tax=Micromonospora sp. CPCC 206060 TaxID=3122406 RepID=UPI002FF32E52
MAETDGRQTRRRTIVGLLTLGMAFPMLVLYALGVLGPQLVDDLTVSRSTLGSLVSASFGVAAVGSLWAGAVVDRIGVRAALALLFVVSGTASLLMFASTGVALLAVAVSVSGLAQALANPATNRTIVVQLPAPHRAAATGLKQSGVQLAALAAGLCLPPLALATNWRVALGAAAPLALAAAVGSLLILRRPDRDQGGSGPATKPPPARLLPKAPGAFLAWIMVGQLFLGCGLATLNVFLPLYVHSDLGVPVSRAALLVAAFGVAGIIARIGWTRLAGRQKLLSPLLAGLGSAAAASAVLLWSSRYGGIWLAVLGTVGIAATAVAANAVAMLLVVRDRRTGPVGHASALASLGFFAGFAISPPLLGLVADVAGFGTMWLLLAAQFALAGVAALRLRSLEATPGPADAPTTPTAVPAGAGAGSRGAS